MGKILTGVPIPENAPILVAVIQTANTAYPILEYQGAFFVINTSNGWMDLLRGWFRDAIQIADQIRLGPEAILDPEVNLQDCQALLNEGSTSAIQSVRYIPKPA